MNKNAERTEEYIKLLHSINSCADASQLKTLSESVIAYHREKKQDSAELLAAYVSREDSLFVE